MRVSHFSSARRVIGAPKQGILDLVHGACNGTPYLEKQQDCRDTDRQDPQRGIFQTI